MLPLRTAAASEFHAERLNGVPKSGTFAGDDGVVFFCRLRDEEAVELNAGCRSVDKMGLVQLPSLTRLVRHAKDHRGVDCHLCTVDFNENTHFQ